MGDSLVRPPIRPKDKENTEETARDKSNLSNIC